MEYSNVSHCLPPLIFIESHLFVSAFFFWSKVELQSHVNSKTLNPTHPQQRYDGVDRRGCRSYSTVLAPGSWSPGSWLQTRLPVSHQLPHEGDNSRAAGASNILSDLNTHAAGSDSPWINAPGTPLAWTVLTREGVWLTECFHPTVCSVLTGCGIIRGGSVGEHEVREQDHCRIKHLTRPWLALNRPW